MTSLKVDQKAKFVPRGISAQFIDEAQCYSWAMESTYEGKEQLELATRAVNYANIMDSPHSSATSAPMPIYQTLLPFFPL